MSRIFISYTREDRSIAIKIYRDLKHLGLNPWIDTEDLLAGEKWKARLRTEIRTASHFIALLSSNSVDKRGVVQWEIREAIETLQEVPENQIYFLPVRLEECNISHSVIRDIHWIDLFPDYELGFRRIAYSLGAMDIESSDLTTGKRVFAATAGEIFGGFLRGLSGS